MPRVSSAMPGPVQPVAVAVPELPGQRAGRIDGIQVRDQHQLLRAGAGERSLDERARPPCGLEAQGRGAERLQSRLRVVGHSRQADRVAAARFDRHHVPEAFDDRRLLYLRGGE